MDELDRFYERRYSSRGTITTVGATAQCACPGCQTVLAAPRDGIGFALMIAGWEYREYTGYVCGKCVEKDQLE